MEKFDTSPPSFIPQGLSEADYYDLMEHYDWFRTRYFAQAETITGEILDLLFKDDRSLNFSQLRSILTQTADIEESLQKLDNLLHAARRGGSELIRCILVEGVPIPVSHDENLTFVLGLAESKDGLFDLSISEALYGVRTQLGRFLVDRLAYNFFSFKWFPGGMSGTPNMLSVRVSSHSVGARVSYTPCYFIDYLPLAAPTSPVQGFIPPGRYLFRLTTLGPRYLIDQQVFDIPPTFDIALMV